MFGGSGGFCCRIPLDGVVKQPNLRYIEDMTTTPQLPLLHRTVCEICDETHETGIFEQHHGYIDNENFDINCDLCGYPTELIAIIAPKPI